MGLVGRFRQQGLQPAHSYDLATKRGVMLPWGGATDTGNSYDTGLAVTLNGGTAQPEIWTLTIGGGSGSYQVLVTAGGILYKSTTIAYNATAATVLAALQLATSASGAQTGIFPEWMLPTGSVTGSAAGPYTITFAPNARLGYNVQFVTISGAPSPSLVRAQRGCVGAGQYDVYDGSSYTTVNGLLVDGYASGISGAAAGVYYEPTTDATFCPDAWMEGFFYAADIPNILSGAVASGNIPGLTYSVGSSVSAAGTIVRLMQ